MKLNRIFFVLMTLLAVGLRAASLNPAGQSIGAGTVSLSALTPNANAVYTGIPDQSILQGTNITAPDGAKWLIHLQNASIKFTGITFIGFSIHVDYAGSTSPTFDNCVFINCDITATGGMKSGTITHCKFTGTTASSSGISWRWSGVEQHHHREQRVC